MEEKEEKEKKSANIFVVDDNEVNRQVLAENMEMLGYGTVLAENGRLALSLMETTTPDLVLLDVMMPEMDGYQVLKKMKAEEKLKHVPVIMISALEEIDVVASCIQLGAEDYLFKPFNPTLLHARVASSLEKKRLRDIEIEQRRRLEHYKEDLEEMVLEKTRELQAANERLEMLDRAKSDFLTMIGNQLRAPLYGLFSIYDMLFDNSVTEKTRLEYRRIYNEASERIGAILDHARLLTEIQLADRSLTMEPIRFPEVFRAAVHHVNDKYDEDIVETAGEPPAVGLILGQAELLCKGLELLLDTAAKLRADGRKVSVECSKSDGLLKIVIKAPGKSLPVDVLDRFFEIMAVPAHNLARNDMGLGAVLAEKIFKLFNGKVEIENAEGPAVWLICSLPEAEEIMEFSETEPQEA